MLHRMADACEGVKWTTLTQILKVGGTDWCDRRLIRNLYTDPRDKLNLDQWETRRVNIGRDVRQGCCFSPILFNFYSEYLTKAALEDFGDCKIGRQVIRTVKYADSLALRNKQCYRT